MIRKQCKFYFVMAAGLLSTIGVGINADTLFVGSLEDGLGSVATLRQTILDASSGDTIEFDVNGTIMLDESLGKLVVDRQLTIDGQNKITVDGGDLINTCFHITNTGTGDASGSLITNITIQNFNGHDVAPGSRIAPQELPAYGILIDGGAENCSVTNTTIKNINSGIGQNATALFVTPLFASSLNNCISDISVTNASTADHVGGIRLSSVNDGNLIESNTILRVTGGQDALTFGIKIEKGNNLTIHNNVINLVENSDGPAHGLLLGTDTTFVTNSHVSCNGISNIRGGNGNGFGITITGNGSVGNDLLHKSIFDINGKAINIVTVSDARIVLKSVFCFDGCKLTVNGSLVSMFGSEVDVFVVQFFVSDSNNPSQTKTFIGEKIVEAGNFKVKIVPSVPVTFGQFITATATALPVGSNNQNNNTSEVSNALASCKPASNFCPCPEMVPDETCKSCD